MKYVKTLILIAAFFAFTKAVIAQTPTNFVLDEIVVQAQSINNNLQEIPISVQVLDGDTLIRNNLINLIDVATQVPGFKTSETALGSVLSIRGVSSGLNQGFEQSVGTFIDGTYISRENTTKLPLFDIEQIEILKGPQSVLFDRSTIGGAVVIKSARPHLEGFEGMFALNFSPETNLLGFQGASNIPMSDNTAVRVALFGQKDEGYNYNRILNRTTPDTEYNSFRVSLVNDFNDFNRFYFKYQNSSFNFDNRGVEIVNATTQAGGTSYLDAISLLTGNKIEDNQDFVIDQGSSLNDNSMDNFTFEWEHSGDQYQLTANTSYIYYDNETLCDCDFTRNPDFQVNSEEQYTQISQQFLLSLDLGPKLELRTGLNYFDSTINYEEYFTLLSDSTIPKALVRAGQLLEDYIPLLEGSQTNRNFDQKHQTISLFAELQYQLTTKLELNVGLRYSNENKRAQKSQVHINNLGIRLPATTADLDLTDSNQQLIAQSTLLQNGFLANFKVEPYAEVDDSLKKDFFTPLLRVKYKHSDDVLFYGSYVSAYKVGGFDVRSNAHPDPSVNNVLLNEKPLTGTYVFDEETVDNIEFGVKSRLLDNRLELNVSLYSTNFKGLQTSEYDGTFGFNVRNIGSADITGLEIDSRFLITDKWSVALQVVSNNFSYKNYPNALCYFGEVPTNEGFCDRSGSTRELAPKLSAYVNSAYTMSMGLLDLVFNIDIQNSSSYFASQSLDPNVKQSSFSQLDLSVSLVSNEKWQLQLKVKNATDVRILNFANQVPISTVYTSGTGVAYYGLYSQPRSVQIQFKMHF